MSDGPASNQNKIAPMVSEAVIMSVMGISKVLMLLFAI